MNKPSYRAVRLATLGAAMAFLLGACGESPPEGEQQQGSVTPPAATDQSTTAEATTEDSAQTAQ